MNKKRQQLTAILGIVVLVLVFVEWRYGIFFGDNNELEKEMPAESVAQASAKLPVTAMVVKPELLSNDLRITGSILPDESVVLRPEASGRVTGIYFNEGQHVKKGQRLLTINDAELRAQLERAKYTKKLLEETEFRQKTLLEREAISKEEYDVSLTELNTAQSDINIIEAQLDKSEIRAPFDGVIGLRYVSVGSYISPSDNIASLYNINPVKVEFSIPSKYTNRVKTGDQISFKVEGIDREFGGKIYAIEPQIELSTRTLKLRAVADNSGSVLLPGLFTNIRLTLNSKEDAILVPSQAVVPELQGHKVYVNRAGKAMSKKVTLGIRTETQVEILNGLNVGDTVLTSGILQLRDGTEIRPNIN